MKHLFAVLALLLGGAVLWFVMGPSSHEAVSHTHLTLQTIYAV